jgi:hypothetical protein
MERAMTDKRDTSGARQKHPSEAHLGQVRAEEEKESEEKLRHMGRSGQEEARDPPNNETSK